MLGLALKLLGIGKAILGWFLGIIKGIFEWCQAHPLLALAIAVDIALLCGCWWGYGQHRDSLDKDVKITQLNTTIQQKDSLIDTLYQRVREYAEALRSAQNQNVKIIQENNQAVDSLKHSADERLAAAQREAEKSKKQRDQYFMLSEKYRHALTHGGTPEERIANEEKINREFIHDFQGVRK